jgi:hypothetical protein
MKTLLEYMDKEGAEYGAGLKIMVFPVKYEYCGSVVALVLTSENAGAIVDHICNQPIWQPAAMASDWFPIGVGATHYEALERLRASLEQIEYNEDWIYRLRGLMQRLFNVNERHKDFDI